MSTIKYRPYLSEENIKHILSLAKADSPISHKSKELIMILAPYLTKIENDIISGAYQSKPKQTLMESLGEVDITKPIPMSIAVKRELAYTKWAIQGADSCTIEEIELAYEYRVHKDMLTEEEKAKEANSWDNVDMSKYTDIGEAPNE